jgi:predicted CxxxxCH...CXXCH cytochrome family protein
MRQTASAIPLLLLAAVVAGCGEAQPVAPGGGGGGGGGPTTGAHPVHLNGGAFSDAKYACDTCHSSGFQVTFPSPSLARSNGASPTFDSTAKTCSNVYCHVGGTGAGNIVLGGGTVPSPGWDPPGTIACGACHALPGGLVATPWHPLVASGVDCAFCHAGYTRTSVDKAVHVNGQKNVKNVASCTACHGDSTKTATPADPLFAAPPVDRSGSSATTRAGVGAHQAHLTGTTLRAQPVACTECHTVPPDLAHVGPALDTPASLTWGPLATTGGLSPAFNPVPATCSATYCHGASLVGGSATAPQWTRVDGSQISCTSCHGSPPATGQHALHVNTVGLACSSCHLGYTYSAATLTGTVNPATHVNGITNVNGTLITTWNPATSTCTAACHGTQQKVW